MKTTDLQTNQRYVYINFYNKQLHIIRYSGTARDVKDLMHWFFYNESEQCIFLNESEVNSLTLEEISL